MKHTRLTWMAVALFYTIPAFSQSTSDKKWIDFSAATASAWSDFESWKEAATNEVVLFPPDSNRALFALYQNDIDPGSMLAAFILHSGGMLADHGWIRVLGSGCPEFMRGFKDWNAGKNKPGKGGSYFLLIADDVVGGFFALKMDPDMKLNAAKVWYFGSNNLQWVNTGLNYPTFLRFCMSGDLAGFYSDFRWKGWQEEITVFNTRHTIGCYPLLWTREGKELKVNRKVLPLRILF